MKEIKKHGNNEDKENNSQAQAEHLGSLSQKGKLEQTLLTGMHGTPQLKKAERQQFLGQFRERVMKVLTFSQIKEKGTYQEVQDSIRDPRAHKLIVSSLADLETAREYIRLARQENMKFTVTNSPEFKGDIALVVASNNAVDEENIFVENRNIKLKKLGIPQDLINAVGEKICPECLELIKNKAPGEEKNYRHQTILDRILGHKCPCN